MAMILDHNNYPDSYNSQMQRPARGQTQLLRWRRDGRIVHQSTQTEMFTEDPQVREIIPIK